MSDYESNVRPDAPDMPPALQEWAGRQPPERRRKLRRSWALAGLAEESPPAGSEATDATWEGVADALWNDSGRRGSAPGARRAADHAPVRSSSAPHLKRRLVAALLAVALLAGTSLWLWVRPVTVAAPPGATETVRLPDGSRVVLNSASSLTYRRSIPLVEWKRHIQLKGEALFEVEQGKGTFTVATFNARLEVTGTRFNVRARPEAETPVTTVTLATGALRLLGKGGEEKPVTLAPGQQSLVTGRGGVPTPPAPADLRATLAWRRGALAFPKSQLDTIFDEVERRFAVEIRAPRALRRDSLSLYLSDAPGPAAVLTDLCAVQGCSYDRTPDGVFVVE